MLPRFEDQFQLGPPETRDGSAPLRNFRKLLWFWELYYARRPMDRATLAHSSGIQFDAWWHIHSVLCAPDGGPGALLKPGDAVTVPFAGFED